MIVYWVEGDDDKIFLDCLLKHDEFPSFKDKHKIGVLNGVGNIKKKEKSFISKKKERKINIIIIDSDTSDDKVDRTKILKGFKKDKVIKDYFFIEKNLENFLLENIKNQSSNYETYLECFSKYEECIKKALSVKSKFYAFFEAYFLQQGYSKKRIG